MSSTEAAQAALEQLFVEFFKNPNTYHKISELRYEGNQHYMPPGYNLRDFKRMRDFYAECVSKIVAGSPIGEKAVVRLIFSFFRDNLSFVKTYEMYYHESQTAHNEFARAKNPRERINANEKATQALIELHVHGRKWAIHQKDFFRQLHLPVPKKIEERMSEAGIKKDELKSMELAKRLGKLARIQNGIIAKETSKPPRRFPRK